jgi:hypothetical protein
MTVLRSISQCKCLGSIAQFVANPLPALELRL